jgi:hypothetical protein
MPQNARDASLGELNAMSVDEVVTALAIGDLAEQRALVDALGDERYRRMRELAVRRATTRSAGQPGGNIVVLHGIMGAELTSVQEDGGLDRVWLNLGAVFDGSLGWLQLATDGWSPTPTSRASSTHRRGESPTSSPASSPGCSASSA